MEAADFGAAEPSTALQPDGIEPELGLVAFTFDMHVRRFVAVADIEKER
jgi:hypothetical protein